METIRDYLKITRITGVSKYIILITVISAIIGAFIGFEFGIPAIFIGFIIWYITNMKSFHPNNIKLYPIKNSNISGFYFAFISATMIISTLLLMLTELIFHKDFNVYVLLLCLMMSIFYMNIDCYFIMKLNLKNDGKSDGLSLALIGIAIMLELASFGFIIGYTDGYYEKALFSEIIRFNGMLMIGTAIYFIATILTYIFLPKKLNKYIIN